MWWLVRSLGGQVRFIASGAPPISKVTGWDMAAALALASARGLDLRVVADWLPRIEDVMRVNMNKQMEDLND